MKMKATNCKNSIHIHRFILVAVATILVARNVAAFHIACNTHQSHHHQDHNQIRTTTYYTHSINRKSSSSSLLLHASRRRSSQDEDVYEDEMEEVLAMGGDPFFLSDNSENNNIEDFDTYMERKEAREERVLEIQAAGGDPFFLIGDDDDNDDDVGEVIEQTMMQRQHERKQKDTSSSTSEDSLPSPLSASSIFGAIGGGGSPFGAGAEDDSNDSFDVAPPDMDFAEIEAMGGDPFFLSNDDDSSEEIEDPIDQDDDDDDPANLSAFASMALSSGGGVMDLLGQSAGTPKSPPPPPPPPPSSSMDMERAALEDMGGDPFFLGEDVDKNNAFNDDDDGNDETAVDPSSILSQMAFASGSDVVTDILGRANTSTGSKQSKSDANVPISKYRNDNSHDDERGDDWEWDGIVDEEAHLDLY